MSAEAKMQPDPVEPLKRALSGPRRGHDFFDDYVTELERMRAEEDIFIHLAFLDVRGDGLFQGGSLFVTSVRSEWYEPLDAERKPEVRRWWHEKARREAGQFDDLRVRLAKLT